MPSTRSPGGARQRGAPLLSTSDHRSRPHLLATPPSGRAHRLVVPAGPTRQRSIGSCALLRQPSPPRTRSRVPRSGRRAAGPLGGAAHCRGRRRTRRWGVTPEDDRTEPPLTGDEVPLVTGFLQYQRETLAWKCARLTPQQLATRAVPTSDLTLLGMVRHLAAVETGWLVGFGGLSYDIWPQLVSDRDEQLRGDADTVTQDDGAGAWAAWHAVTEAVGKVVDQLPLDTADRPWGRHDEYSRRAIAATSSSSPNSPALMGGA